MLDFIVRMLSATTDALRRCAAQNRPQFPNLDPRAPNSLLGFATRISPFHFCAAPLTVYYLPHE